jgi:hypothetical protein
VEVHRFVRRRGSHVFSSLDNRLTGGGEVVSLTPGPPFNLRKIPGTHFCWLSPPQSHSAAGRIKSIENSNDHIVNRIHDLPACSIAPQQTTCKESVHVSLIDHPDQSSQFGHLPHLDSRYGNRSQKTATQSSVE